MVEWLAGNRIRGTNAERTSTTGFNPVVGGWKELGRHTLGGTGALDVSSLADKRYLMYLLHKPSGGSGIDMRLNSDSGTNYSRRYSNNGSNNSNVSQTGLFGGNLYFGNYNEFMVSYVSDLSTKEKLGIANLVSGNTAGAGTAPSRLEIASKWANTSTVIDRLTTSGSGLPTGSELVVLGWDPEDTHTSNFWEELASVDLSGGAADTLSSGTFTAKKYLWIQAYTTATGGTTNPYFRVGNTTLDTGSNYAIRYSTNGAADSTLTSQSNIPLDGVTLATGESSFSNFFIINNASNEKLIIHHSVESEAAGAGVAPSRIELASKWTNTSNQIDIVGLNNVSGTGDFGTETTLKVWGSD